MEITQNNAILIWLDSFKSDTSGVLLADNNTATCYCRKSLWTNNLTGSVIIRIEQKITRSVLLCNYLLHNNTILVIFYFLNKAHYRCSRQVWRRSSLKKGTPCDIFLHRSGPAPWRIWPKNNNTCRGPWVLHLYKVSSKSIKRFWRRTDGRLRTDGWRAMTIGHLSLRLRWAKKQ